MIPAERTHRGEARPHDRDSAQTRMHLLPCPNPSRVWSKQVGAFPKVLAEQSLAGDGGQRPLRSRCPPRLKRGVRLRAAEGGSRRR